MKYSFFKNSCIISITIIYFQEINYSFKPINMVICDKGLTDMERD